VKSQALVLERAQTEIKLLCWAREIGENQALVLGARNGGKIKIFVGVTGESQDLV
jgi:hypothetical protein